MKVLVPLPFDVSHIEQGRNVRVVHLLRGLASQCDLQCVTTSQAHRDTARRLFPGVQVLPADPGRRAEVSSRPIQSKRLHRSISFFGFDETLAAAVLDHALHTDIVLGFDLASAGYLELVRRLLGDRRPRLVLDVIDDPWLTWKSWRRRHRMSLSGIKAAAALRCLRRQLLGRFDALVAIAPRDAGSLADASAHDVAVCPNGVHLDEPSMSDGPREPLVVFTGAMSFPPNEAAALYLARRIWPIVRRRWSEPWRGSTPTITGPRLALVGSNPTRRVSALERQPGVEVTGRVDSVRAWLGRARVAVAPMTSGCGMKNKILEACAMGCPVIATPMGCDGLPAGEDNGVIVASGAGQIADEIIRLLRRPENAERIGRAGRDMVRSCYTWSSATDRLLSIMRASMADAGIKDVSPQVGQERSGGAGRPSASQEEVCVHAAS